MTALSDRDDALAAEYALGVLDGAERAEAEARIARDPAFEVAVAAWVARLSPLNAAYAEVPAPAAARARIEARLFGTPPARRSWWQGWLGNLSGGAVAAMLVLVLVVWQGPPLPPPPASPLLQASLSGAEAPAAFVAVWDGSRLTVTRTAGAAAPEGRDYQLWLIGDSGVPESLGLLRDGPAVVTRADLRAGLVLAVSLEPSGGAPGPAPTGPVLVMAVLEAI